MAVQMELVGVRVELPANQPVLMLRESTGEQRIVPIYIGVPEAQAIQLGIDREPVQRPMTHDMIKLVLDDLAVSVDHVLIESLDDSVFYANLVLNRAGERHVVSVRPSDAVALAVRADVPIYADESVIEQAGYAPSEVSAEEPPEEVVEQFREFIDSVKPEDFGT